MLSEFPQQSRSTRRRLTGAILGLSLATATITACGGSDGSASTTVATTAAPETTGAETTGGATTDAAATAAVATQAPETEADAGTDAAATNPPTTAGEEAMGAESSVAGEQAATMSAGTEVTSADGTAKMEISPEWTDQTDVTGISAWQVGEVVDGFGPTVNLQGQAAPGLDLAKYVDFTKQQLEANNLTLIDSGTVSGKNGQELGYFEYSGDMGSGDLHFMSFVNIVDDNAALATFTAPDPTFGELIDGVRPYLETVEVVEQ